MFDKTSGGFRHKNERPVRLLLVGGEPINATIFHVNGERLTDLLNDPRSFIPVRTDDAGIMIVAKTQIVSILELESETINDDAGPSKRTGPSFDAYAMLRIDKNASHDEIRAAYKARIKSIHPDSIASLGLDEELGKAALLATQKLNYAYRKILRERGSANSMGEIKEAV